ncbi:Transmembrane protein [Schistosoma japonicum]|uniref:Transmembrane protein n=1 Tax=Schistosoma japonicum TaxID=6182 RepID=A0A4Z2CT58_SCHJA|nr:Transmembrane protein 104 like [Schistosoma japonicum]TNN07403.1 Transmembrane protein [Schistosoma japonicum]
MAGPTVSAEDGYSSMTGFIFLFNVIVGTGVLTLPAAFQQAGWLVAICVVVALCFLSFLTFTFVVEALSITNALLKSNSLHNSEEFEENKIVIDKMLSEHANIITSSDFQINKKYELGQMTLIHFSKVGNILIYINICAYLYGDLTIYSSAVPKSIRNVICPFNNSKNSSLSDFDLCWASLSLTRIDVYRILVVCFGVFICPFLFFNIIRSRWLQILTVCLRWIGFILMLSLSIERAIILRNDITTPLYYHNISMLWNPSIYSLFLQSEPIPKPPAFQPQNIPSLFGISVYVFMCHHSIPGIITPVRNKNNILYKIFIPVFITVLIFNLLLSTTAIIAFNHIEDIYTLNFIPNKEFIDISQIPYTLALIIGYFLCLFPVFALTSSYPIIGTSLLGNILSLCNFFTVLKTDKAQKILKCILPFVVLIPPLCIAVITNNVGYLTGFTGAIFGSGIQYIIPTLLVFKARRNFTHYITSKNISVVTNLQSYDCEEFDNVDDEMMQPTSSNNIQSEENIEIHNSTDHLTTSHSVSIITRCSNHPSLAKSMYASPFQHIFWIIIVLIWALVCTIIVLIDKIHHV